jgi:hypothetical protein
MTATEHPDYLARCVADELIGDVTAVRAARSEGLTMRQVADRIGVSIATVHRICTGKGPKKVRK